MSIAATSGTDNFSDVWRDPPPGADRTYVQIRGPLSFRAWIDGVKAQRTFGTTGPLVFFTVEGRGPGEDPWFFAAAFAAGRLALG